MTYIIYILYYKHVVIKYYIIKRRTDDGCRDFVFYFLIINTTRIKRDNSYGQVYYTNCIISYILLL